MSQYESVQPLQANGNLLITLFNGYGDAYLALPVLREIARRFCRRRVYMATFVSQAESIFWDLPFEFIAGEPIIHYGKEVPTCKQEMTLPSHLLTQLKVDSIAALNDFYPLCRADGEVSHYFPNVSRWAMYDLQGKEAMPLPVFQMNIRDQYFKMLGWEPCYSPEDRRVSIDPCAAEKMKQLLEHYKAERGNRYYVLHLDSADPEKIWPIENWINVIKHMWMRWQAWPLVVGKDTNDARILENTFDYIHKVPEEEVSMRLHFAAIHSAPAFVGVDSVFGHVADSFDVPSIIMFAKHTWCSSGREWLAAPFTNVWGPVGHNSIIVRPNNGNVMSNIAAAQVIDALEHALLLS